MKNMFIALTALLATASTAWAKPVPSDVYDRALATAGAYLGFQARSVNFLGLNACQFDVDPEVERRGAWSIICSTSTPINETSYTRCTGRALISGNGDQVLGEVITQKSRGAKSVEYSYPVGECSTVNISLGDGGNNGYGQ
jgi:hypothetical protein